MSELLSSSTRWQQAGRQAMMMITENRINNHASKLSVAAASRASLKNIRRNKCDEDTINTTNAHLRTLLMENRYPVRYSRKKSARKTKKDQSPKQQGLIFIWPQNKKIYLNHQNIKRFACILAHTLYWLHVTNILPSGPSGLSGSEPSWEIPLPVRIPKPVSRNNIIEPDWDCK